MQVCLSRFEASAQFEQGEVLKSNFWVPRTKQKHILNHIKYIGYPNSTRKKSAICEGPSKELKVAYIMRLSWKKFWM